MDDNKMDDNKYTDTGRAGCVLNIYQRINKIREACPYIQKDTKVQGYRAVTHDLVTSELRPWLTKFGVITELHQKTATLEDTGKATSSGTPITRYMATYVIHFINEDEPSDFATVEIGAMAEDQGDKAPGKCASYAMKYAMLKIFSIETGESEESRQEQKPNRISDDQFIEITDLLKESGADVDMFKNHFEIETIYSMDTTQYAEAKAMLKKKIEKELL
jgi:hypothetical protein